MRFSINKNGKVRCHVCRSWCELEKDKLGGICHEFTCCGRNYLVAIDTEGLEKLKKGESVKPLPPGWWLNNKGDVKNE